MRRTFQKRLSAALLLLSTALLFSGASPAAPCAPLSPLYLASPEIAAAYDLFKEGRHSLASEALEAALERLEGGDEAHGAEALSALSYLAARVARSAGRQTPADERLAALSDDPVFGPLANLELGQRALQRRDRRAAVRYLTNVSGNGPALVVSRRTLADLPNTGAGDRIQWLREALAVAHRGARPAIMLDLAGALLRDGQRGEALALLERIWREYPRSGAAARAETELARHGTAPSRVARLNRRLSGATAHNATPLLREIRLRRRQAQSREVAAEFDYAEGVILSKRGTTRERGIARLWRAWRRTRQDELRGHILVALATTVARDDPGLGQDRLDLLFDRLPDHPATPDGKLLQARLHVARGALHSAREALDEIAAGSADLGLLIEAQWQNAWINYRSGSLAAALSDLTSLDQNHGQRRCCGGAATWGERTRYWIARATEQNGQPELALEIWEGIVTDHPLTYYGFQSWSRIEERAPERLAELRLPDKISHDHASSPADLQRLSLTCHPDLALAFMLVRIGLYQDAVGELETRLAAGTLPPDGLTLAAALRLRLGDLGNATQLMHRYGRHATWPAEATHTFWKLAYPLAYQELIEDYSAQFELSPALSLAVVLHESNFNPDSVSYARAVGLGQLMPGTARAVAERLLHIPPPPARALRDPAINLLISVRYLRELVSLFNGDHSLAVAAYNVGPGRLRQWWREATTTQSDEFLEELPFRNTASYTRKVMSSYFAYSVLYGQTDCPLWRLDPLPQHLVPELGPFMIRQDNMQGPEEFPLES